MENFNAQYWVREGIKSQNEEKYEMAEKCYESAIECCEKALLLNPNDTTAFFDWGNALYNLAVIKKDEALFRSACDKFEKATQLYSNKASAFYNWGTVLYKLAEIKQDEALFRSACDKFEKATQLDPNYAPAFYNWGNVLYKLAKIKQDEPLFRSACEKYEKATQLDPNDATAFNNWGNALNKLAGIKQDEPLFRSACEKYEKATQLDPNYAPAFYNWGTALSDLAGIKQDKALFRSACDKYEKATRLDPNYASAFYNWGTALFDLAGIKQDEALFRSACDKYEKATQLDPNFASAFNNWGNALYKLAKIKQDEAFQENLEIFEQASKEIDDPQTLLTKGELYFLLYQKENCPEYGRKVRENFEKSKNDILRILTFLDKDNEEKIIKSGILHSLLDLETTREGKFFKETIGDQSKEQKKEYKDIYIHSISIISRLHVNNPNEKLVAHYREKEISHQLLIGKTKFRLNAINYSNDPSEGKTLLDFLFGEEKRPSDEKTNNEEYEAFAGCFVFDYNNLNMFRLYGKNEEKKEGTGLSLVFRDSFFSKEAKMVLGSPKTDLFENNNDNSAEKDKLALYRCIYIDPDPETVHHIVTVGRKEEYLFYREKKESKLNGYNEEINDIIAHIREEMDYIKDKSEKLDHAIVGQLLLNLRYLVKHVAFKEEQECRIVKIHHINDGEVQIDDNYKKMYIEYLPDTNISKHINKICFGPKASGFELFKRILKNKNLNIPCEQSKNPFA